MALTNVGLNNILNLLHGAGGTPISQANCYVGVGDSTTGFDPTQTDLQATTNKLRVQATSVDISANVITIVVTYGSTQANYAWNEWGIFNGASGGVMFNRVVKNNGVKVSGSTWTFTVTITLNAT